MEELVEAKSHSVGAILPTTADFAHFRSFFMKPVPLFILFSVDFSEIIDVFYSCY